MRQMVNKAIETASGSNKTAFFNCSKAVTTAGPFPQNNYNEASFLYHDFKKNSCACTEKM